MIKLDVEEYCQSCPKFEAETIKYFVDGDASTVVKCANNVICRRIKKYLEEKKNEQESQ